MLSFVQSHVFRVRVDGAKYLIATVAGGVVGHHRVRFFLLFLDQQLFGCCRLDNLLGFGSAFPIPH